jgi:hypothetical protein
VADHGRGAPILLVVMARPELLEQRPGWAGGKLNATTLLLEPLDDAESARLLAALAGPVALPEAAARPISRAAQAALALYRAKGNRPGAARAEAALDATA